MRQLRELTDRDSALLLCDALQASGVEIELMESQRGDSFAVWVVDERQLPKAHELAAAWLDGGQDASMQDAARKGRAARELTTRIEDRRQRQREAVIERMAQLTRPRATPLTWGLIALCVAVYVAVYLLDYQQLARRADMEAMLTIMDARKLIGSRTITLFGHDFRWLQLPGSEPWRLLTPALLHLHLLHIVFNMLWLRDLGRVIEARHGARYLAGVVLVGSALPNILQYEIAQSPQFGGMSGVVYMLLALIWLRGKLDPRIGYGLPKSTVQFMLIWLAFGFFPDSHVANWCHLGGLLAGLAWAYIATKLSKRRA